MPRSPAFSRRSGFSGLALAILLQASVQAADDRGCITLLAVTIEANEIISEAAGRALTDPMLGRCIDVELTRDILSRISAYFIDAGYVTTRPYLLEQNVGDGQIEVRILPGRVEAVIDADTGTSSRRIASAFRFNEALLNLREIETSLETLERTPSVQAEFEIRPGMQPGGSIVAVKTTESKPLRLELGANAQTDLDSQLSLQASLDNLFDINDIVSLRFNSGELREIYQSNRSRELAYSFPLGAYLLSFSHADIGYTQRIQGIGDSFVTEGDTVSKQLGISRIAARDQYSKITIGLSLKLEDTQNFLEGELIEVSSYRTSQLQFELRHDWYRPWGQLQTGYIFHQGLDSFGARDDDYFRREDGAASEARLQFEKFSIDSQLVYYLSDPSWQISHSLHLQYTDDTLYDSDKLNLGSPYTVRGYASALSGGNAWYLRNDLSKQLHSAIGARSGNHLAKSISMSIGLDYGEVECETDNPDACGEIYGAGLGLVFRDANFSGRLLWGHPLKETGNEIGREDQYLLDLRWLL